MNYKEARASLVGHLSKAVRDERVLDAMLKVPRECFIPFAIRSHAYDNAPLAIGFGQTISQPLIVAIMCEAMELRGDEKVLEIGTGSGYQAAILAELASEVITTERVEELAQRARLDLKALNYDNVDVRLAEEELGFKEGAPYDAIIVSAAAPKVPEELLSQLVIGGRLVIPVGDRYEQTLYKITKMPRENTIENLGGCRFVPLIGKGAWELSD